MRANERTKVGFWEHARKANIVLIFCAPDVRELCWIDCHLPTVARPNKRMSLFRSKKVKGLDQGASTALLFFNSLPKERNGAGEIFRKFDFDIIMSPRGENLDFEILYQGARLKTVSQTQVCGSYYHI